MQQVDSENHLRFFPQRKEAWDKLKISDSIVTICECLKNMYYCIYSDFFVGSDKYAKFQLKWYQQCSVMLSGSTSKESHPSLSAAIKKWNEFKNINSGYSAFHLDCIIVAIQSAIFNQLAKWVAHEISLVSGTGTQLGSRTELVEEPDDVYLRFGGAAIAEMLKHRYRSIHTVPEFKRNSIATEIAVLKAMECQDKSVIPSSLQYRHQGFMYFPDPALIPFVKAVDDKVRTVANDKGIVRHGKNTVAMASDIIKADKTLPQLFKTILKNKFESPDSMRESIDSIYSEFTRKLYNTRLAEFIDCYRQKQAAEKGSATLSGQNLRDTLLSQHTNLKTLA